MTSKRIVAIVALAAALMSGAALARTSVEFGLMFGPGYGPYAPYYYAPYPYYPPYYSYPPYYAYPPAIPAPAPAPPSYVEQAPPPAAEAWWYYCPGARAYYPYVKECAGGWQRVSPTPPAN
jgi:hypothetical protein